MKNTSKSKKQSKTSKICEMCGKEHHTKWAYCSNDCVLLAQKRSAREYEIAQKRIDTAKLLQLAFLEELKAEALTTDLVYYQKKVNEENHEKDVLWYLDNGII